MTVKLRQRLLFSFISVTMIVLIIFGSIAYYITIDFSNTEKTHFIKSFAEIEANNISRLIDNTENNNLRMQFSNYNFNTMFSYILLSDANQSIANSPNMHHIDVKDLLSRMRIHISQNKTSGNIYVGNNATLWFISEIPQTRNRLVLIHFIDRDTSFVQAVGIRFFITGVIITWFSIWGALILSAQVSNRLDKQNSILVHHALHDYLTDLPNRYLLHDRLQQTIHEQQHTNARTTLLLINIKRFKEIIDTLGHRSGDTLLKQIGPRLKSISWQPDTIARLDGDQFGVLLPNIGKDNIDHIVRKVLQEFEKHFPINELVLETGITIGATIFPDHGSDADALIRQADVALYQANKDGCDFTLYSPESDPNSIEQLTLMSDLRHALENDELELHYQPKLSLRADQIIGAEALLRWQHPTQGYISPDDFIPMAEQSGLIKPITAWIMKQALIQYQEWKQINININIAINISRRNLYDNQLINIITNLMRKFKIHTCNLEFEITETAIMADPENSLATLHALKKMGIKLSIDDFGTGFTSLSHLKELPIDELKIDKSFILGMPDDIKDHVIVSTIIELAHNMGCSVVAEGVESQEIQDMLTALKCDTVQGYYISKPLPAKEFIAWLNVSGWHK